MYFTANHSFGYESKPLIKIKSCHKHESLSLEEKTRSKNGSCLFKYSCWNSWSMWPWETHLVALFTNTETAKLPSRLNYREAVSWSIHLRRARFTGLPGYGTSAMLICPGSLATHWLLNNIVHLVFVKSLSVENALACAVGGLGPVFLLPPRQVRGDTTTRCIYIAVLIIV